MSEDLILKVFIGTLLVLVAIPIFIWCLNWFIDETYELYYSHTDANFEQLFS